MFHGSPRGEKNAWIGREAVVTAHEIVAEIPSYFVDPRRACPATTFYESAQLRGVVNRLDATMDLGPYVGVRSRNGAGLIHSGADGVLTYFALEVAQELN